MNLILLIAISLVCSSAFARLSLTQSSRYLLHHSKALQAQGPVASSENQIINLEVSKKWQTLDPENDSVQGVSSAKAHLHFGEAAGKDIIVAVIDNGVDINHADLAHKIWVNQEEIPNNGIDDDNNGYIDDVTGWNFLGNTSGQARHDITNDTVTLMSENHSVGQIDCDTDSSVRELLDLIEKEKTHSLSRKEIFRKRQLRIQIQNKRREAHENYQYYQESIEQYNHDIELLKSYGLTEITLDSLQNLSIQNPTQELLTAIENITDILQSDFDIVRETSLLLEFQLAYQCVYNIEDNTRKNILGDNHNDINNFQYGNNNVFANAAVHGTHVAGIIAANSKNEIGISGIASKVKIMPIRAIPSSGDERDRDVAAAIRYAVDNGAKIINMSFGKYYSRYADAVDSALRYAEDRDVLIVQGAGNDSLDIDTKHNYPRKILPNGQEIRPMIIVGASTQNHGIQLVSGLSNYGHRTVDFFAPGEMIYSLVPGNQYAFMSGTSMSAPMASGVAALLMSFAPDRDAIFIKDIMTQTTRRFPGQYVVLGGMRRHLFSELSLSGGLINAYLALEALLSRQGIESLNIN